MSLFSVRETWSCQFPGETFSPSSVVVGEEEEGGGVVLALGSLEGVLRIFALSHSSFRPLLEVPLESPILGLELGQFMGRSGRVQVVVLHPFLLRVYSVSEVCGKVDQGGDPHLTLLFQHVLKRHGWNMVVGPFGGGMNMKKKRTRDSVAVQSLDGTLSVFSGDLFGFSRFLPAFLLPGPLSYVEAWDSFLSLTSSWDLEVYKYESLALGGDSTSTQLQDTPSGNKLSPVWRFCVGEEGVGRIGVVGGGPSSSSVLLLTPSHLFCFQGPGELLWTKRLDFLPTASTSFLNSKGETMSLIGSGGGEGVDGSASLFILNGTSLKWAARVPEAPVWLGRVRVGGVEGGVVLLTPGGRLSLGFLGSTPALFLPPPLLPRTPHQEGAQAELEHLRSLIAAAGEPASGGGGGGEVGGVEVKLELEGQSRRWVESTRLHVMSLMGRVKLLSRQRVNEVRVTIWSPPPILCTQESLYIGDIVGRQSYGVEFFLEKEGVPGDLEVSLHVFFLGEDGSPHYVEKGGLRLPLFLVATPAPPLPPTHPLPLLKLTFTLNHPPLHLRTLYPDFEWGEEGSESGVGFGFGGGEGVSLLMSTKGGGGGEESRFRLTSTSLSPLHLVFKDFVERVRRRGGRGGVEVGLLGVEEEEVPLLREYLAEVDGHLMRRVREREVRVDLEGRTAQLRAVQRRLLVRLREKSGGSLVELESLLEGSLDQITDGLNFLEVNGMEKERSEGGLSGGTHLLLHLSTLGSKSRGGGGGMSVIHSALSPYPWSYSEEEGWEEVVLSGLSYLRNRTPLPPPPFPHLDPLKLKRLIQGSLEKVMKGRGEEVGMEVEPPLPHPPPTLPGTGLVEGMSSGRGRGGRRVLLSSELPSIHEPIEGPSPPEDDLSPPIPPSS